MQFHSCGTHFPTSGFKVALEQEGGDAEGGLFFASGATPCVAFAQGYNMNLVYAVMVSNSEIACEL